MIDLLKNEYGHIMICHDEPEFKTISHINFFDNVLTLHSEKASKNISINNPAFSNVFNQSDLTVYNIYVSGYSVGNTHLIPKISHSKD